MSDQNGLADQLNTLAAQMGMQLVPKGGNGWSAPPAAPAGLSFVGVSVPIKVETPMGSVRCYVCLPAEAATSLPALTQSIERLFQMGLPVDAYQRREQGWGGGGGGGGGWGRGGGGGGGFQRRFGGDRY